MLAQVDEVTSGQGKVIPSSKVQLIQAAEPATIQRIARPLRPAGRARAIAGAARRHAKRLGARPDPGRNRSRWRPARRGSGPKARADRPPAPAAIAPAKPRLQQVRQSALRSQRRGAERIGRAAPPRSRPRPRRRSAACRAAWRSPSASRDARAAGGQEHRPADRLAQRAARSGRPAGPHRRGARAVGRAPRPRSAKRRPRPARPASAFRQDALNERSQINAKIAVNEQSLARRARAAQPQRIALAGRRRGQRRPGDDHRRLRPGRARRSWKSCRSATNCSSKRASSRATSPSSRSATRRWSRSPPMTSRSTAGSTGGRAGVGRLDLRRGDQGSLFQRHRRNRPRLSDLAGPAACRSRRA